MQRLPKIISDVECALHTIGENTRTEGVTELRELLLDTKLRVVVFGAFNHGKSTFINAHLGRVVLPAKLIPTTGHVTHVAFGTREHVRVRFLDTHTEVCDLPHLAAFSSLNHDGMAREDIDSIEVVVNSPFLKDGLVLTDTPGLNEHHAQTARAQRAIAKADLVLLVLNAQALLTSDERSLATDWLRHELGKPVALVVNFMNRLEEEKGAVRARLAAWYRDNDVSALGQPCFEVNALGNLAHAIGKQPTAPGDDFEALRAALSQLPDSAKRDLQHRARHGQMLAEIRRIEAENSAALVRLRRDAARVARERSALHRDLQEQHRRFEANAAVLRARLELSAATLLNKHLEILTGSSFRGETKERLEANANAWYEQQLSAAVEAIESQAQALLRDLAGEHGRCPAPLTVQERITLNARLAVGELPLAGASDAAVGWGVGLGALIGMCTLPGIGTIVGGWLGGVLADILGSSTPDYAAAYTAKAREAWAADAAKAVTITLGQFDARAAEMQKDIVVRREEVEALLALPQTAELQRREALHTALQHCQHAL